MNEDEWEEILQRFNEEGLDSDLPDNRKLLYVWHWLVDAETNCISLRHQLDKLGRKQADELKEIRSCMEQMCNSWEAKVSTLEEENQRFQEQLDLTGQNAGNFVAKDIRHMLINDGLHEILGFGLVEQFAFILDERVRLKQLVDQEVERRRKCEQLARMVSNLPDCLKMSSPQIQRMLDRQKDEYEEEIRHQQETMKQVKEQLKEVHEEEMNRLTIETARLNEELIKATEKIQELINHMDNSERNESVEKIPWLEGILNGTYEKDMKDLKSECDQLRNLCQDHQKQIREQSDTLRLLERSNKQLELDNDTLAFKLSESLAQIDELEDQFRRETHGKRDPSMYKQLTAKDLIVTKNNLNKSLNNRPMYQEVHEDEVRRLQTESSKLQENLESVEKQLEMMTMKYQQHKEKYRDKMFRLRDIQDREQLEWKERFESSQKELSFVRSMLAREQEWRLKIEADCQKLQSDQQHLNNGSLEQEQALRDAGVLQREVDFIKAVANQAHPVLNGSPSRKNSIWPLLAYPKKW